VFPTWASVYNSDLQGFWALVVVPLLFLLWRWLAAGAPGPGVEPRRSRFVERWARLFALETIADPVVTGAFGVHQALVPFVLLGDFRVFLLVFGVAWHERALGNVVIAAARWTLVVPIVAWLGFRLVTLLHGPVDLTVLWLVYETAFVVLATWFRQRWVPATVTAERPEVRRYLRAVLAYVILYYALWVTADVLILAGVDAGWGLRIVPNQLYYAFWVPFAWGLFMARSQNATSASVQAVR
jgi:hypothetical protein